MTQPAVTEWDNKQGIIVDFGRRYGYTLVSYVDMRALRAILDEKIREQDQRRRMVEPDDLNRANPSAWHVSAYADRKNAEEGLS